MLKGFKDFLLRGNIVDLAVAVVIGTAFTALVTALTSSFINPLIARAGGGGKVGEGLGVQLGTAGNDKTFLDIGTFVTAIITFVITAAVVYLFVVIPMKKMVARRTPSVGDDAPPAPSEDVVLLREIKDLLAGAQRGDRPAGGEHL